MNKIVDGLEEALAVAKGEKPAARIYTPLGGPYAKDERRSLIQHQTGPHRYIVWNWNTENWDVVTEPVRVIGPAPQ